MDKDEWDKIAPAIQPDPELVALLKICLPVDPYCEPYVPEKGEFLGKHILETRFKNFEVPLPTESKKNVGFEADFQKIPDSLKARYAEWEKQVLQEFPQSKPAVLQGCVRCFFSRKARFSIVKTRFLFAKAMFFFSLARTAYRVPRSTAYLARTAYRVPSANRVPRTAYLARTAYRVPRT